MKEIGVKLKEKRIENGLTIEEAAEDLKVRPSQLTSLEEGVKEEFNDILFLKYLIGDYSKYLGLDSEKVLDELNEYLFDLTSKIPLEQIEAAKEKQIKEEKVSSPYTKIENKKIKLPKILIPITILVIIIICYIILGQTKSDFGKSNVTYIMGGQSEQSK